MEEDDATLFRSVKDLASWMLAKTHAVLGRGHFGSKMAAAVTREFCYAGHHVNWTSLTYVYIQCVN